MNFQQFIWRNTYRNKHLYLAYFLSILFAVTAFFSFSVFLFHPSLSTGIDNISPTVTMAMRVAAGIIYLFSFFFVMYSMDIFLQTRKKEFGTFMIQGMSPKQLRNMVFRENLVIGFFATICGIVVGVGFSQLILLISERLLRISLALYFPTLPIIFTFVSFMILFLFISLFIQGKLPKLTLQELLKSDKLGKGAIKFSTWKSILAIVLILVGYGVALAVRGSVVIFVMIPVIVVVILGTSFFFNQFTIFLVEKLKGNKQLFWKKTNLLVFSDLGFRMKDNARSFFLVAIISTVGFTAITTLVNFQHFITLAAEITPYEFSFTPTESDNAQEAITAFSTDFEQALEEHGVQADSLLFETLRGDDYNVISVADYNELAHLLGENSVSVDGNNSLVAFGHNKSGSEKVGTTAEIGGVSLTVEEGFTSKVLGNFAPTMIVSNQMYQELATSLSPVPTKIWQPRNASEEQIVAVGDKFVDHIDFFPRTATIQTILDFYAPILFTGVFIGIVFFVAAGSFLYFRLFSDIQMDIEKFRMISKIGLTRKELRKMISQQVGILFFTPIALAIIHGVVALTAMNNMFERGIQMLDLQVLGVFLLIQVVYYGVCRWFYARKVEREVIGIG